MKIIRKNSNFYADNSYMKRFLLIIIILLSIFTNCFAQEAVSNTNTLDKIEQNTFIPRSYRNIELGMNMETVKEQLVKDSLYNFRGDPDVSLLYKPNESIIEVFGSSYVRRAFFQFYNDSLYVMIFVLNESKMDYYSMFTTLSTKYGKPNDLSPSESVWVDFATRMSLEKPLTIKYLDLAQYNLLLENSNKDKSMEEILLNEFLKDF